MHKSAIVAFIALISIVALSLAANTKYTLTTSGGLCTDKVSKIVETVNYEACTGSGITYTKKSCSGDHEITETYSNSQCTGTPSATVNTTLTCFQKCAEEGSPQGFSGTYAKVEKYDSCTSKTKTGIEYYATDICVTLTTNNVTTSNKYGCTSSGEMTSNIYDDRECKTLVGSFTLYPKECGADVFNTAASTIECNSASTAFAAFSAVVIAVVAFFAL